MTYILDMVLVVLIRELMSLQYAEYNTSEVIIVSIFVIAALIALRIATTTFSPDSGDV